MNDEIVGKADVKREGLYYRFVCTCMPPDNRVHRIFVSDGTNTRDLGICIPMGERFFLSCRVPIKYLPGESLAFSLVPKQAPIPVYDAQPFPQIDKLDSARFQVTDGQAEILIDSTPDQQGSDPSREFPHRWEQQ